MSNSHRNNHRTRSKTTVSRKRSLQSRRKRNQVIRFIMPRVITPATERELLDDITRVARKLRTTTLSAAQYSYHGKFQSRRIISRFTSWTRALAAVGLVPAHDLRANHQRLMWNLREVWTQLGRAPIKEDMVRPRSRWSSYIYMSRYGGWSRALQAFLRWNQRRGKSSLKFRPGCAAERRAIAKERNRIYKRRLRIDLNRRYLGMGVRFKVLERDSFCCVACGRSPATHKGLALHVDHIKPASRGGGLGGPNYKNLQTLCRDCNYGKKDRVVKKRLRIHLASTL